jgi:D-alanine-D-alanine ligase
MRKKSLSVLVLFEVNDPPEAPEVYEEYMTTREDWFTEGHVVATLRENGHEVHLGPIFRHPREVIDLVETVKPDLVWNFVEAFRGNRFFESNIAAVLELLEVRYTGCGHRGLLLCQDKALSKEILKHHRIHVPRFVVSRLARPARRLTPALFPVLVKPLAEEGSVGISRDSFAETPAQALKRVEFLHERFQQDVIVEQFIAGREIYVGVLGDTRLTVLPPRELRFSKVPEGEPKYASFKAKWDSDYRERWGIYNTFAEELPDRVLREIDAVARRAFRVLQMRGYGRIDIRLTEANKVFVVEANPNPQIAMYEDFAEAARKAGISYNELIEQIARMGCRATGP